MGDRLSRKNTSPVAYITVLTLILIVGLSPTVMGRPPGPVRKFAIDKCRERGKGVYKVKYQHWCCNCPPGFYKEEDCSFNSSVTTACKPCVFDPGDPSKQTYMDVENNNKHCFKLDTRTENDCPDIEKAQLAIVSPGQAPRCQCIPGYFWNKDFKTSGCQRHSVCGPGLYPSELGNSTFDTKCVECPTGTFSNVSSATVLCVNFTKCEVGENVTVAGTSVSDVICSNSNSVSHEGTTGPPTTDPTAILTQSNEDTGSRMTLIITLCSVALVILRAIIIPLIAAVIKWRQINRRNNDDCDPEKQLNCSGDSSRQCGGSRESDENANEGSKFLPDSRSDDRSITADEESEMLGTKPTAFVNGKPDESDESDDYVTMQERPIVDIKSYKPACVRCQMNSGKDPLDTMEKNVADESKTQNEIVCNTMERQRSLALGTPEYETLEDEIIKMIEMKANVNIPGDAILHWRDEIVKLLKDTKISWEMLLSLQGHSLADLRHYMRIFLKNVEINDEEHGRDNAKEIKYQWLLSCQTKLGRELTPKYLLDVQYEQRIFRDGMMDEFVAQVLDKKIRD